MTKNTKRLVLFFLLFSIPAVYGFYLLKRNFHTVIPGEFYRSAQMDSTTLKTWIQKHDIRTVINLRGKNSGKTWYENEIKAAAEAGARHYDVDLTSTMLPRVDELRKLYQLLGSAEQPVLVHCKSGADRSGLASALTMLLKTGTNLEDIEKQASWRFLAFAPDSTGKLFLYQYRKWLEASNLTHSVENFSRWMEDEYVDGNGNFYYLIEPIYGQVWKRPDGGYEEGEIFSINRKKENELFLKGWAFDNLNETPLQDIKVYLGQIPLSKATYGIYVPHLMNHFGKENYLHTGWEIKQPLDSIKDGCYDLTLHLIRKDGEKWVSPPQGRICIS